MNLSREILREENNYAYSYSFAQRKQGLTIIVLLNGDYSDYERYNLQDITTSQNLSERIEEKFGKDSTNWTCKH